MDLSWVEWVIQFVVLIAAKLAAVTATIWLITRIVERHVRRRRWPAEPRRDPGWADADLTLALDREQTVALCRSVLSSFDAAEQYVGSDDADDVVQGLLHAGAYGLPNVVLQLRISPTSAHHHVAIRAWPLWGFGGQRYCQDRVRAVRAELRAREQVELHHPAPPSSSPSSAP